MTSSAGRNRRRTNPVSQVGGNGATPIRSYVVRIYRRDADLLAGLVEAVQSGRTASFQSLAELCDVLSGRKPFRRRPARRRGAAAPAQAPTQTPA
jgi:hypothetical protein